MSDSKLGDLAIDSKPLSKLLHEIFLLGLVIYFLFYLYNGYQSIIFPYQIDYGEGFILNQAYILSNGCNIYLDITTYPYIISNYPPVYPLICAGLVKFWGVSFATGRFISVVSALLIGFLLFKIIQEETGNKYIAIISSLLFFASPYIYEWTCMFRVDTLGLLFSLIGIYIVFKYQKSIGLYLSIPFFILAVYTKQSFIAAPIASFIYLYIKDRNLAVKNAGLFAFSGIVLFLVINYVTNGQFYLHTIVYNINPYSIVHMILGYIKTIQIHTILFVFAVLYTLYTIFKKEVSLFPIYFLIAALVAFFTAGKSGAYLNYYIELIAVSCILFGLFLSKLQPQLEKKDSMLGIFFIILLITQLILFAHMPYVMGNTPTSGDRINGQKISSYITNTNGSIFSSNAGFIVADGKNVLFDNAVFTLIEREGLWNQSKMVDELQNKTFSIILLKFDINNTKENTKL